MKNVEFPINPLEVMRLYKTYYQNHLRDNKNYKALPSGVGVKFYAKAVKDIFPILEVLKHNKDIIDIDPVFLIRKRFKEKGSIFYSTEEYNVLKRKSDTYLESGPDMKDCDCESAFAYYRNLKTNEVLCETCMHSFLTTGKDERKISAAKKVDLDELF